MTLREEDLPAIYQAADRNSLEAQHDFLQRSKAGLISLLIAALAGAFTWQIKAIGTADLMGIIAAVAFGVALLMRVYLFKDRPERTWYDGRAVAESAKTLAWRYSVGAEPFDVDREPADVDAEFSDRIRELLTDVNAASLVPQSTGGNQITLKMRELRNKSLSERKEAYQTGRIEDQRDWYSRKAKWNNDRARYWNLTLMLIEVLGLGAAILKAAGVLEIDLLSFAAALVAAGASWLQAKQHTNLAEAYSVAAHELSAINARISSQTTDDSWSRFVTESEEAISREHTLWRASRTSN